MSIKSLIVNLFISISVNPSDISLKVTNPYHMFKMLNFYFLLIAFSHQMMTQSAFILKSQNQIESRHQEMTVTQ